MSELLNPPLNQDIQDVMRLTKDISRDISHAIKCEVSHLWQTHAMDSQTLRAHRDPAELSDRQGNILIDLSRMSFNLGARRELTSSSEAVNESMSFLVTRWEIHEISSDDAIDKWPLATRISCTLDKVRPDILAPLLRGSNSERNPRGSLRKEWSWMAHSRKLVEHSSRQTSFHEGKAYR
jgi:hypothetical protein